MGREGEVIGALVKGFEAENPGIRVRVTALPNNGAHEKLLTGFAGDSLPDMAQMGNTWVPEFERSEEHTSELQSLMRISYAVFCLKKKQLPLYTQHTR